MAPLQSPPSSRPSLIFLSREHHDAAKPSHHHHQLNCAAAAVPALGTLQFHRELPHGTHSCNQLSEPMLFHNTQFRISALPFPNHRSSPCSSLHRQQSNCPCSNTNHHRSLLQFTQQQTGAVPCPCREPRPVLLDAASAHAAFSAASRPRLSSRPLLLSLSSRPRAPHAVPVFETTPSLSAICP
jgi:hypothetical protein